MDPQHLPAARRLVTLGILGGNVAALAVMIAWDWPRYWTNINYEKSPLTWFSSVQLLTLALVCIINGLMARWPVTGLRLPREQQWLWTVLGAAFVYLSVDERFQIHERLREGVFKPHDIGTHIPGIAPGDFLLVLYGMAGLVVARRLWRYLERAERVWLVVAVVCSAVAVGLDAVGVEEMAPSWGRFSQFLEECMETTGQATFLVCFTRHACFMLTGVTIAPR